jgi:zinc protease
MRRIFALALVAAGACATGLRRPPAAPPRSTSLGLAIASRTLPNGLRVVTVRDPRASEVQVTMRYQVGASADAGHPGIAHLVEHLMFQQELAGQPLFTHLEDTATYFNAATTFDATTYIARGPTAALDKLLAFEAIRIEERCKSVSDAAFTREQQVVESELEQRDQASAVYGAIRSVLYPEGHPYRQLVGGTSASVAAITRAEACAFADAYYAPNNAVLVVSGPLTQAELDTALARIEGRIAKRIGTVARQAPPVTARPQQLEVSAPIDDTVLVLAWPLPVDPELRAKLRAIGASLPRLVDAEIKGTVVGVELGDTSAPMFGIAVLPGDGEAFTDALDGTKRGIEKLPSVFRDRQPDNVDQVVFDRLKQGAIYGAYSDLEEGSRRDEQLAIAAFAGLEPGTAVADKLDALSELLRTAAAELASKYFGVETPTIVTLKPMDGKKRGEKVTLRAPVHDFGRRRAPVDPELAFKPAMLAPAELAGARMRVLPNGLRVVVLPVTTVPTFEARMIFGAGTGDEPEGQKGVALVAAHTLTWDLHHINDVFAFMGAGGMHDTDVATDRTSFSVQGLDMNLDLVLAGLRRWVRDGVYDDSSSSFMTAMRRVSKRADDQGVLTDTWRASLFGVNHPYVKAGLVRHANAALTVDDARSFRAAHYTPDNATLVIAGRFDPALADRWVDYLFADWTGHAAPRQVFVATPQPASIAMNDDTSLAQLRIAIPVEVPERTRRLVTAEMLGDIARDVRHRLGASYTFDAQLVETRPASFYLISGFVDSARAKDAVELVDKRIRELRDDATAAARAFVTARSHVLTRLRSRIGSASALADRVEADVEMARTPMSDLKTASGVAELTIADMGAALGELDLARATVLVDGPAGDIEPALAAIGRQPTYVQASEAEPVLGGMTAPSFTAAEQSVLRSEVEPALTLQPPPPVLWSLSASLAKAELGTRSGYTGYMFAGSVGYRYALHDAIGLHVDGGRLTTTESRLIPIDLLGMWHVDLSRNGWGEALLGVHLEKAGDADWREVPLYGFQGGVRVAYGLSVALRWQTAFRSDLEYSIWSLGVAYGSR